MYSTVRILVIELRVFWDQPVTTEHLDQSCREEGHIYHFLHLHMTYQQVEVCNVWDYLLSQIILSQVDTYNYLCHAS